MDGSLTCSRLGCERPAVAVFAFDARACLVWLDPVGVGGRGAGVLCDRHADRMSPPRGWNLLDRRTPESRLWIGRPAAPAPTSTDTHRRERPRSRTCAPTDGVSPLRLPFESTREPEPTPPTTPSADGPWSPHTRPGPELEHVLDARTPLLARAFGAARRADGA